MDVSLSAGDLITVSGATAFALIFTQFVKALFNSSPAITRAVALLSGVAVVVSVTLATGSDLDFVVVLLAAYTGMNAGLAASATFDAVSNQGLNYTVSTGGDN